MHTERATNLSLQPRRTEPAGALNREPPKKGSDSLLQLGGALVPQVGAPLRRLLGMRGDPTVGQWPDKPFDAVARP